MLILNFDNIHRFCIVASILCLKQILDCVHIVPTVIGYVNILLKSIVSRKSKRTGYQICFIWHCVIYGVESWSGVLEWSHRVESWSGFWSGMKSNLDLLLHF